MKFSLVVTTLGRTTELETLFQSLRDQSRHDFEVIIADQNRDSRVKDFLGRLPDPGFPVTRLQSGGGASKGRNDGISAARGEIIGFPDDDCAFPPLLLEQVSRFFATQPEYGYLSGRSYADDGRDSVSRHAKHASAIRRETVHAQCIEFAIFIRRDALGVIRFDEAMGPGAATPWQCDEGPDLFLRLEANGVHGYYDPGIAVWHPRPVSRFDQKEIDRTFRYGCGNGYFFRKHGYRKSYFAGQMTRSACGMLLALGMLRLKKVKFYSARLRGRWRGWNAPIAPKASTQGVLQSGLSEE